VRFPFTGQLAVLQVDALLKIGYNGYLGFEFCHQLPIVDDRVVVKTIAKAKKRRIGPV
jgi:hypothetical protein